MSQNQVENDNQKQAINTEEGIQSFHQASQQLRQAPEQLLQALTELHQTIAETNQSISTELNQILHNQQKNEDEAHQINFENQGSVENEQLQIKLRQHIQQKQEQGQDQNPYLKSDHYGSEINEMDFQNYQNNYQNELDLNQERQVENNLDITEEEITQNFQNYGHQQNSQFQNTYKQHQQQIVMTQNQNLIHNELQQSELTQLSNQLQHLQKDQTQKGKEYNFIQTDKIEKDNDSVNSYENHQDRQQQIKQVIPFQSISQQKKQNNVFQSGKIISQARQMNKLQEQPEHILVDSLKVNPKQLDQRENTKEIVQVKNIDKQTGVNVSQPTYKKNKKNKKQLKSSKKQTLSQTIQKTQKVDSTQKKQQKLQTLKQQNNILITKQDQETNKIKNQTKQNIVPLQRQKQLINKQKSAESDKKVNQEKPQSNQKQPNQNPSDKKQQIHSRLSTQIQNQVPLQPIVPAIVIIKQAQQQRIGTTYNYFLKYMSKHDKHVTNQKKLISNIEAKVQAKKLSKYLIQSSLKQYFQTYISMCKDFHQKSYKFTKDQKIFSINPLLNIKQQLKIGFQQLIFQRKSTGNDYQRLADFIQNVTINNLSKIFENYWNGVNLAQKKQKQKKQACDGKQKQFKKRVSKIDKIYTKGKDGVIQQEDVFVEMAKFIRLSKQFRLYLIDLGRNLLLLKKAVVKQQEQLYQDLQLLLNEFKNQTKSIYSLNRKQFTYVQKFEKFIKEAFIFNNLSDLIDVDYVKSVLELHQKGQNRDAKDKDFEAVFQMNYFDNLVGNSNQLLKGTTSKIFEMKTANEQLVNTISGNLVLFNRQKSQQRDKFITKNINAKIVADGVIQIDELLKGIIFDSNRTVRITLKDNDRAEELIFLLNDDAQREENQQNNIQQ